MTREKFTDKLNEKMDIRIKRETKNQSRGRNKQGQSGTELERG